MTITVSHPNDYQMSSNDLDYLCNVIFDFLGTDAILLVHFQANHEPEIIIT